MEPLIFALIAMAVGAFFKNKKQDGAEGDTPQSQSKPARSNNQRSFKRVEDYAKEIYGEFQSQMKEQPKKVQQTVRKAEEAVSRTPLREARQSVQERNSGGRLSVYQPPVQASENEKADNNKDLFPLTQSEAQRGIILAEILMPPKSKR